MAERPAPIINVNFRRENATEARPSQTPAFVENGVSYFREMPLPPENKPRTTLLRMSDPGVREWVEGFIRVHNERESDPRKKKGLNWEHIEGGIKNPNYGAVEHVVAVDYDEEGNLTNFRNDGIVRKDGLIDEVTERPTPGAVFLPIEKRSDGSSWVHFKWQFRPNMLDGEIPEGMTDPQEIQRWEEANRGRHVATGPGGFADSVGETAEAVAKREALEEGGIRIGEYNHTQKNFNRASETTAINVGYGTFEKIHGADLSGAAEEFLQGDYAVPFEVFASEDAMVDAAYLHAARGLGFIRTSSATQ